MGYILRTKIGCLSVAACRLSPSGDYVPRYFPPRNYCCRFSGTRRVCLSQKAEDAKPMASTPTPPPYAALLKDAKTHSGLLTLHHTSNNRYAELQSGDYNAEYIVLISIAAASARARLLGGMSWGFGDDWVWQFRKVGRQGPHRPRRTCASRRRRTRRKARAVPAAYTDSVLFSLPIVDQGSEGGDLVDLTPVFMSDLPQISQVLPGFIFSPQKSSWAKVQGVSTENMELEVAATYASSGQAEIDTVPDSPRRDDQRPLLDQQDSAARAISRDWPTIAWAISSRR